jgi:4-amino-4-deoxy-L-arabinose transferase-like glycosyltransferase
MRRQLLHQLWIAAAAAVICFTTLGSAALWDEDEPLYATCAWEMLQRGDWVVPYYNGEMFPDKPPLMFWMMIAGYEVFGRTEFAVRFWSALLGVGTGLLTYHLGRLLFRAEVGLWAGLVVCSSLIFTISARAATVDSALTFFTTLGILLFVAGGIAGKSRLDKTARDAAGADTTRCGRVLEFVPRSFAMLAAIWAAMGVAVLAKGPIGLLLPMASLGLFVMLMNHQARTLSARTAAPNIGWKGRIAGLASALGPANFLRSLWQLRPLTGVIVVLAVAGPWFVLVGIRDDQWLHQFFAKFNWRPFTQPILGHQGPVWYHVPSILIGFFPWSIFMVPMFLDWYRGLRRQDAWCVGYLLIACWLGVFFVFWSICKTKLPHYLLPAYPALALATGAFIDRWLALPQRVNRWWFRVALGIAVVVGFGISIAVPLAASIYAPGEEPLGLIGLVLVFGGGLSLYFLERDRPRPVMVCYAVTSVALLLAVFGLGTARIDRYQFAKPLVDQVRAHCPGGPQMAGYRFTQESVVYYAAQPVPYFEDSDELRTFLDSSKDAYVLTTDRHAQQLLAEFPGEFDEVTRRNRFLRSEQVVVLARRDAMSIPQTAAKTSNNRRQ